MGMTYVRQISDLPVHDSDALVDKALLLLIAGRDGADNGTRKDPCFASYDTLALQLGKSRRTVIRRIGAFKDAGWITVTRRRHKTALLRVDIEKVCGSWTGREVPREVPSRSDTMDGTSQNSRSDKNGTSRSDTMDGTSIKDQGIDHSPPFPPPGEQHAARAAAYDAVEICQWAFDAIRDSILNGTFTDEPFDEETAGSIVEGMIGAFSDADSDRAERRTNPKFRYEETLRDFWPDLLHNDLICPATEALAIAAEQQRPGSSADLLRDLVAKARATLPGFIALDGSMPLPACPWDDMEDEAEAVRLAEADQQARREAGERFVTEFGREWKDAA